MADILPQEPDRSRASVASWLGVLLVMMLSLNTLGGWVRLSGSGIAIPQWPLIHGSLLPPLHAQGWAAVRADWEAHQRELQARVDAGTLAPANLGRTPQDDADFRSMFLTEYAHRLLAALTAVVLAGCLTVVWRRPELRRRAAVPLTGAAVLVIAQAVLGGLLVDEGTGTHFLFLHQGNAALILLGILWALLSLLEPEAPARPVAGPRLLRGTLVATLAAAWLQLLVGALVAGSRAGTAAGGFLDDQHLHLWLHRIGAWAIVAGLGLAYALASRGGAGPRLMLALQVAATFLAVQIVLGIGSQLFAGDPGGAALPLAHQLMGMCLFVSLGLACFDARTARLRPRSRADGDPSLPARAMEGAA